MNPTTKRIIQSALPATVLRVLPNEVRDQIINNLVLRRVQRYVLKASDINSITTGTNIMWASILSSSLVGCVATSSAVAPTYMLIFLPNGTTRTAVISANLDAVGGETLFTTTATTIRIGVALGTWATLAAAQAALAGTVIYYQLATPVFETYNGFPPSM